MSNQTDNLPNELSNGAPMDAANVPTDNAGGYVEILKNFLNVDIGAGLMAAATDGVELRTIQQTSILENCRIDDTTAIDEPQCVVYLAGQRTMSRGDISAIVGAAKGRKTLFATAICNVLLGGGATGAPVTTDVDAPVIVYVDTEQSPYHSKKTYDRVTGNTTKEARERLYFYAMRELSPVDRLTATCAAIDRHRPQFCVIDGIADLMTDANSSTDAPAIVGVLMAMAKYYDCHICSILHTSAANVNKGRGHLGSELERKCETIAKVEKDLKNDATGATSSVVAQYTRNAEFNNLIIRHDNAGGYELTAAQQAPKTDTLALLELAKDYVSAVVLDSVPDSTTYLFTTAQMVGNLRRAYFDAGGTSEFSNSTATRLLKKAVERNQIGCVRKGNKLMYYFDDWAKRRAKMKAESDDGTNGTDNN